jgi:hypothetical protein
MGKQEGSLLDDAPHSAINKWLNKTECWKAVTLAVFEIVSKFEHCKSSKTEDPLPDEKVSCLFSARRMFSHLPT